MSNVDAVTRDGEISRLIALRRKQQGDEFIDKHDKINDDGDKVQELVIRGPANTEKTIDCNLSKLFGPAPSTTSNLEILRLEAEMVADGHEPENPHIPVNSDTLNHATAQIESAALTPAWEYDQ
jgi:hypothetical protein